MSFTNPYTIGNPVGKTLDFVGREDVLREVVSILRSPNQNAITLHGQRRIGKTSILQYLEIHLHEQGNYLPIFFDLMNRAALNLDDILRELARTIALKLQLPDPKLGTNPQDSFRTIFLKEVLQNIPIDSSLVLLLDEFDVLADPRAEQYIKTQFFSYLRELRQYAPQQLQFVFVLGRNVDDLDVVARGLFKDLPAHRISLFLRKDAESLIRLSESQSGLNWSTAAIQRVWDLTSGHPFLTQALCYQIWDNFFISNKKTKRVQPSHVEDAISGTIQRSNNMLVWLWDGLGPAEKIAGSALAGLGSETINEERLSNVLSEHGVPILIGELRDAPRKLKDWDILASINGGYCFRVELLRLWISQNKPISRVRDELDRIKPLASDLYSEAFVAYDSNNFLKAKDLLIGALASNPNHVSAHELLSEVLIIDKKLDEAQQILEQLHQIAPEIAIARLKQVYLGQADKEENFERKILWYQKILKFLPKDSQALGGLQKNYQDMGDKAQKEGELQKALQAFQLAGDKKKVAEIGKNLARQEVEISIAEIQVLEQAQDYEAALSKMQIISEKYPKEDDWSPKLKLLQDKASLLPKYQQALLAIQQGYREKSEELLKDIVSIQPRYKKARHCLKLVKSGARLEKIEKQMLPPNQLNERNPLDWIKLFFWALNSPSTTRDHVDSYGSKAEELTVSYLVYYLTFSPLLMLLMGFGLGYIPQNENAWLSTGYFGWSLVLLVLWGLMVLFSGKQENAGCVLKSVSYILALID